VAGLVAAAGQAGCLLSAMPRKPACTDALLASLGTACALTVDGLISPAADGGCLLEGHAAEVEALIDAAY
jgi:hypothetical protein